MSARGRLVLWPIPEFEARPVAGDVTLPDTWCRRLSARGTSDEQQHAVGGYDAYFGRYTVDGVAVVRTLVWQRAA